MVEPLTVKSRRVIVGASKASGVTAVPRGAFAVSTVEVNVQRKLIRSASPVKHDARVAEACRAIVSVERKLRRGGADMVILGIAAASRKTMISKGSLVWPRKLTTRSRKTNVRPPSSSFARLTAVRSPGRAI